MKKKHILKVITVIPYYDHFEELGENMNNTLEYTGDYLLDPQVMYYIMETQEFNKIFDFRSITFDEEQFHFTKQFNGLKNAIKFKTKLNDFLLSFVKERIEVPEPIYEKVKKDIESKRDKLNFNFDGFRVTLVGKKEDVFLKKQSIEAAIDRISEEANSVSENLLIDDINKLRFLNFIDYFKNVITEFPGVQIHGTDGASGKLSLLGTAGKTRDVQLKIYQDMMKISEIAVEMSDRQIDFLKHTQCKIVNDELKKDDAMLLLINVEGALQAKIMSLNKCDDSEVILKSNK